MIIKALFPLLLSLIHCLQTIDIFDFYSAKNVLIFFIQMFTSKHLILLKYSNLLIKVQI